MSTLRLPPCLTVALLLLLAACAAPTPTAVSEGHPAGDAAPVTHATPPAQSLLVAGQPVEGELEEGETDRWVFATAGARLATVEVWFRPSTASGPEAALTATLVAPDGTTLTEAAGTVILPPYIVEQEMGQAGSYLLRLTAQSGAPGRYTLLVTLSDERLLTRPLVYTGTAALAATPASDITLLNSSGFVWPAPQRAISGWYFHDPANPRHAGLDIAAALYDPIIAAAAGTVSFAGPSGGYGNLVIIEHPEGWQTWYAHLSHASVVAGDLVGQGQVIGAAGSTGYSTGPHLHFELRFQGVPVDPLVYLR